MTAIKTPPSPDDGPFIEAPRKDRAPLVFVVLASVILGFLLGLVAFLLLGFSPALIAGSGRVPVVIENASLLVGCLAALATMTLIPFAMIRSHLRWRGGELRLHADRIEFGHRRRAWTLALDDVDAAWSTSGRRWCIALRANGLVREIPADRYDLSHFGPALRAALGSRLARRVRAAFEKGADVEFGPVGDWSIAPIVAGALVLLVIAVMLVLAAAGALSHVRPDAPRIAGQSLGALLAVAAACAVLRERRYKGVRVSRHGLTPLGERIETTIPWTAIRAAAAGRAGLRLLIDAPARPRVVHVRYGHANGPLFPFALGVMRPELEQAAMTRGRSAF